MSPFVSSAFLAILLLLLHSPPAAPQINFPFLPNLLGGVCNVTNCGRGSCNPSFNSTLGFECECDPGWRQARPTGDQYLKFLPCIIPDSCYYTDCGGGICNLTSSVSHSCICEEGFYNLLNSTLFPCYRQCTFVNDCPALNYNTSTSVIDANPFYRFNHGSSLSSAADFACWFAMVVTLARLVWRYT